MTNFENEVQDEERENARAGVLERNSVNPLQRLKYRPRHLLGLYTFCSLPLIHIPAPSVFIIKAFEAQNSPSKMTEEQRAINSLSFSLSKKRQRQNIKTHFPET